MNSREIEVVEWFTSQLFARDLDTQRAMIYADTIHILQQAKAVKLAIEQE